MTFSYIPSSGNLRDTLRALIGDTTEAKGLLPDEKNITDEELDALLLAAGNDLNKAAAMAFARCASAWAIYADTRVGEVSENASKISENFRKLSEQFRKQAQGADDMKRRGFETEGVEVFFMYHGDDIEGSDYGN